MTIKNHVHDTATVPPLADLIPDEAGDYTLTVWLRFDRQDDRRSPDGLFLPDNLAPFVGAYIVEAGREQGAWRLRVSRWWGDDAAGDDIKAPFVVDLTDQTQGKDPLTALWLLLTGGRS